jgi:hypothetical protein
VNTSRNAIKSGMFSKLPAASMKELGEANLTRIDMGYIQRGLIPFHEPSEEVIKLCAIKFCNT